MEGQEIRGLMEAYSQVYETPEVLNEQGRGASVGSNPNVSQNPIAKAIRGDGPSPTMTPAQRNQARMRPGTPSAKPQVSNLGPNYRGQELAAAAKARASAIKPAAAPATKPAAAPATKPAAAGAPVKPAATASTAAKPTASGVVLAKQGGVEGKLDKATGKFTAGAFGDKERTRYNQRAPKTGPATGMLGKTSYEMRRATPAEFQAAQAERERQKAAGEDTSTVANAERALQAAISAGRSEKNYNTIGKFSGFDPKNQAGAAAFGKNPLVNNVKLNTSDSGAYKQPAGSPTPKPAPPAKPKPTGMLSPREKALQSSFDLFDLVKGHLLDEGYADSEEGAMVIMVNMSEAWRESILESHGIELDEAQRARENPEEYERSESRRQSKRERAMNDPHTGINSPAFAEFMRQQMGGKKKKS